MSVADLVLRRLAQRAAGGLLAPQPSSIASNNAGPGLSGVACVTSVSAADPAASPGPATATPTVVTKCIKYCTQCNEIECHIVASSPTEVMNSQVTPRVTTTPGQPPPTPP